jgi:IgGFc binding protein
MKKHFILPLLFTALFFNFSCDDDSGTNNNSNNINNTNNSNNSTCTPNSKQCFGNVLQVCNNGIWNDDTICGQEDNAPYCDPSNLQCQDCFTGESICGSDGDLHICDENGEIGNLIEECDLDQGDGCITINNKFICDTPCGRAILTPSYMGCSFWSVTTANTQLGSQFDNNFGIAVDNSNDEQLSITIEGPGISINETIEPNTIKIYKMPFNQNIRTAASVEPLAGFQSGLYLASEDNGAIKILTTMPVTVYQFNPFDYKIDETTSNSNDASLLLPTAVLTGNYIVMSQPAVSSSRLGTDFVTQPGTTAIVATEDNTTVTFTSTAHVAEGDGVDTMTPGETRTWEMSKGDVLQLVTDNSFTFETCPTGPGSETFGPDGDMFEYCNGGNEYDLTGSKISSSKPVMVVAGHNCANVPYNFRACDHLEELLFPLETWGSHFFVGLTHPVEELTAETNSVKIVSGADRDIDVTIEPSMHHTITLSPGEFFEFLPPSGNHLEITATGPILVGKFTVGQRYWTQSQTTSGDPAFGLVIPVEQFRTSYSFTTPPSMTMNYVNVVAPMPSSSDTLLILDGVEISADMFEEISSGYGVARIDVTSTGTNGSHSIYSPDNSIWFGIEVYGFANYTSYLYPGGLDLKLINPLQ